MAQRPSHRFEEHTGEVRLEVDAPSPEALFAEAGRALAELMLGEVPAAPASAPEQALEVHARDLAALLVEWLNELVFRSETSKRVFTEFHVTRLEETAASGTARGVEVEALKTAVKAATLHTVFVGARDGRWRARVVLDV